MAKDLSVLKSQADTIRNETKVGANTAERIGGMFADMLDYIDGNSSGGNYKGYFQNATLLNEKYPNPANGDYAWVGEPYPGNVYNVVDGKWHDTGEKAEGGLDPSEFATKEELSAVEDKIPVVDSSLSSTSANPVQNKVIAAELESVGDDIQNANSNISSLQVKVNALSGVESNFIGYYADSGSLPSVSSPCWALVGDLGTAKPYAYYTGTVPSGFSAGWNDLSGKLGTYDFTALDGYKVSSRRAVWISSNKVLVDTKKVNVRFVSGLYLYIGKDAYVTSEDTEIMLYDSSLSVQTHVIVFNVSTKAFSAKTVNEPLAAEEVILFYSNVNSATREFINVASPGGPIYIDGKYYERIIPEAIEPLREEINAKLFKAFGSDVMGIIVPTLSQNDISLSGDYVKTSGERIATSESIAVVPGVSYNISTSQYQIRNMYFYKDGAFKRYQHINAEEYNLTVPSDADYNQIAITLWYGSSGVAIPLTQGLITVSIGDIFPELELEDINTDGTYYPNTMRVASDIISVCANTCYNISTSQYQIRNMYFYKDGAFKRYQHINAEEYNLTVPSDADYNQIAITLWDNNKI